MKNLKCTLFLDDGEKTTFQDGDQLIAHRLDGTISFCRANGKRLLGVSKDDKVVADANEASRLLSHLGISASKIRSFGDVDIYELRQKNVAV